MKGNIYGEDIKVNALRSEDIFTIEINGSNFGTDFFKYEQGMAFYRNFARVMGAYDLWSILPQMANQ